MSWRGLQANAEGLSLARQVVFRWLNSPFTDKGPSSERFQLLFYQCLCILFDLCEPLAPPHSLSVTCNHVLKNNVFVDITEFREVIVNQQSLKVLPRYSSPASLRKALLLSDRLYEKNYAVVELLEPLLIAVGKTASSRSAGGSTRSSRRSSMSSTRSSYLGSPPAYYKPLSPRCQWMAVKEEEGEPAMRDTGAYDSEEQSFRFRSGSDDYQRKRERD